MKITLMENPLNTQFELDDADRAQLRYGLMRDLYLRTRAKVVLAGQVLEREHLDLDLAKRYLMVDQSIREQSRKELDEKIEKDAKEWENALSQVHLGDCTCYAMTCDKCMAEGTLGIDSFPDFWTQGAANRILSAFMIDDHSIDESRTCEEAIQYLKNTPPISDDPKMLPHLPRWQRDHDIAIRWMEIHRDALTAQRGAEEAKTNPS